MKWRRPPGLRLRRKTRRIPPQTWRSAPPASSGRSFCTWLMSYIITARTEWSGMNLFPLEYLSFSDAAERRVPEGNCTGSLKSDGFLPGQHALANQLGAGRPVHRRESATNGAKYANLRIRRSPQKLCAGPWQIACAEPIARSEKTAWRIDREQYYSSAREKEEGPIPCGVGNNKKGWGLCQG